MIVWFVVRGGLGHSLLTAALACLGFATPGPIAPAWAIAAGMSYVFREIRQHEKSGTRGATEWMKRLLDALLPLATALAFARLVFP